VPDHAGGKIGLDENFLEHQLHLFDIHQPYTFFSLIATRRKPGMRASSQNAEAPLIKNIPATAGSGQGA
jgi:hypothetical protein